ncbi:MAG: class I SAM-dependent methyltransferase [Clostridiales bacterium]|nr:class I SAM-dependent methyltransferase [Clostridiales bacterium]
MKSTYDVFMSFFEKRELGNQRQALIPSATGRVLEVGSGTGVNLKYYDFSRIDSLTLTDFQLNPVLSNHVKTINRGSISVEEASVESLPFEDNSFDTVVVTLVFCSVCNVLNGLDEIKRVLKDDGRFIFIEHVLPEEQPLREIFNRITPVWKALASNCHLNRNFQNSLIESGFHYELNKRFFKTAFISGIARIT